MNTDNIKDGIDLKALERQMVSGGLIAPKVKEPQDRFKDELREAAQKLGISFDEPEPPKSILKKPTPSVSFNEPAKSYTADYNTTSSSESSDDRDDDSPDSARDTSRSNWDEPSPYATGGGGGGGSGGGGGYSSSAPQSSAYPSSAYSPSTYSSDVTRSDNRFDMPRQRFGDDSLASRTEEQKRRSHIDAVMGSSSENFSFEYEKREDFKCAMLAEIDSLIASLADEDCDLSRIPQVSRSSEYAEVETVLKMLRHKSDHVRYCSFAEELILFGAYGAEELFDGKRTWFGRYKPDLSGWHNTVVVKLKRIRHDTGQLVSTVMQDYNIGPAARLVLELIPNMILYSRMRKAQHGEPGIFSDNEMAMANNRIRDISENKG
jgi:hypothetical protein